MLDRLIDVLLQFIDLFKFWEVVAEYRRGVVFRFGRCRDKLWGPGIHWRMPFGIDYIVHVNTTLETRSLPPQSLTTSDGLDITVSAVVSYRVSHPILFTTEAEDINDVIGRVPAVVVSKVIDADFDDIATSDWVEELFDEIRETLAEVRLVSQEYLSLASGSRD
jgi:regulator of protease activity HflC (stomatin/prohibitin superfamily)